MDLDNAINSVNGVNEETGDLIEWLKRELPQKDVELYYDSHTITVTGMFQALGDFYITYRDDETQENNAAGDKAEKIVELTKVGDNYQFGAKGNNDFFKVRAAISEEWNWEPAHADTTNDRHYPGGAPMYPMVAWTYQTAGNVVSSAIMDSADNIYIGSNDNRFHVISSGGTLAWSYVTAGNITSSPAINASDTVHVGSEDNQLYAFSSIGDLKWSYLTGGALESSPTIDYDSNIYIGGSDNNIYAFTSVGALLWSYLQGDDEPSSPAIDATGGVYIGALDNKLYRKL